MPRKPALECEANDQANQCGKQPSS